MAYPNFNGSHASFTSNEEPILPFTGVSVSNPNGAALVGVSIKLLEEGSTPVGDTSNGILQDGSGFTGTPTLKQVETNTYQIHGTVDAVTAELDALSFKPAAGYPGGTRYILLSLIGTDSTGASSAYYPDVGTEVFDTTASDQISISPQVSYQNGTFTLSGTASSAVGVSDVEITATLGNGRVKDLGAATVNSDGSFTFADRIGPRFQGFITATETDSVGDAASANAVYSLQGGLRQDDGVVAEQDVYTPDGSTLASVSHFQPDGVHTTDILTPGQTLSADYTDTFNANHQGNSTFVYNPGHGSNVVTEFRLRGTQHDTLSFAGADFDNSIADVLRHAQATPGGVTIHDPTSGDTVQLAGVSKAGLFRNQGDIAFHT